MPGHGRMICRTVTTQLTFVRFITTQRIFLPFSTSMCTSMSGHGRMICRMVTTQLTIGSSQNLVVFFLSTTHVKVVFLFYISVGAYFICCPVFLLVVLFFCFSHILVRYVFDSCSSYFIQYGWINGNVQAD